MLVDTALELNKEPDRLWNVTCIVMDHYSVIKSAAAKSPSDSGASQTAEEVSFTYAFQCAVVRNEPHHFNDDEIEDYRYFLGEGATSTIHISNFLLRHSDSLAELHNYGAVHSDPKL